MDFRVLGPLEVYRNDHRVELGSRRRERCLLGVLLLEPGRLFSVERLVELLWDEEPPVHARSTVRNHVSRLRGRLDPDRIGRDGVRLIAHGGGYLIELEPDRVDAHRFTALVEHAQTLAEPASRSQVLREALTLWRGPLLADVGTDRLRSRLGGRLDELRLTAVETALRADLACGRTEPAAAELADLVEAHPDRERLLWLFMLALYRLGRQTHALAAYHRARERLADQFGLDLGTEVQALHEAILRCDPGLESALGGESTAVVDPAVPARPAQLPAPHRHFVGRAAQIRQLDGLLAGQDGQTTVVISAIAGAAGIGKTALALHWAHRVADQFPDGQLYVDLRGFHPGGQLVQPATAVRGFLDALGVPAERIPADPDAQAAMYRSLLADQQVLLVLDNARDAEQVRPLLPGTGTALVLVTSRNQLTSLVATDGAHPLTLDLLTPNEAHQLLERRLGPDRTAAEPRAVEQIISACARLPLALAIAAARAAQTGFPLTVLAAELANTHDRLGVLDAGDAATRVRAVFSWSYATLTSPAARLFRLLGLQPGPDLSAAAAASLAGLPLAETNRLLAELTRASLTTQHTPGRYSLHDLLAAYATELCHTIDPDDDRRTAVVRLLGHYAHTAHTADRLLHPSRDPILLPLAPPAPGTTPEQPADHRDAMGWLDTEWPVLLAAVRLAATTGFDTDTWQLAWTLHTYLDRRGHWQDLAGAWQLAVAAADRLTHPTATAYAHRYLAWAGIVRGRHSEAHTHLHRALDLTTRAGDHAEQAKTHNALAYLWERLDRPDQALNHAQQALTLRQAAGNHRGQASALNMVGWCHALLGDHTQALAYCQQALTLFQQAGDRTGEANTWDSLGYAHHHLHQHTQAADCYQHALTLSRDLGDRYHEADTLTHLGDTHHAAGNPAAADTAWQHALTILTDLDHPDADKVRAKIHDLDRTPTGNGS